MWSAMDRLVCLLNEETNFTSPQNLSSWKSTSHIATAREAYGWRNAIDSIKNTNLIKLVAKVGEEEAGNQLGGRSLRNLMTDRPLMLKIAGEITNALLHSYNRKHRISFAQSTSN
jgi:hypothetical protein